MSAAISQVVTTVAAFALSLAYPLDCALLTWTSHQAADVSRLCQAAGTGPTALAISKNPTFKEELTAVLIQTLRQHPRASVPVPEDIPSSGQASQQSQDVALISEGAAYSQCIAELTDWLGSSKIALQVKIINDSASCHLSAHPNQGVYLPAVAIMNACKAQGSMPSQSQDSTCAVHNLAVHNRCGA